MCKRQTESLIGEDNYIYISFIPATPPQGTPTRLECEGYEYMTMVQLCNISEAHGMGRSKACNAFGGDRGKYKVQSVRMARLPKNQPKRKYVLVSAVIDYFAEIKVTW